jgi:hypothetical protein
MATRAKFRVNQITQYTGGGKQVKLMAVTDNGDPENKAFWNATPAGTLDITISNPDAADFFKVGQAYYLDFTEAA